MVNNDNLSNLSNVLDKLKWNFRKLWKQFVIKAAATVINNRIPSSTINEYVSSKNNLKHESTCDNCDFCLKNSTSDSPIMPPIKQIVKKIFHDHGKKSTPKDFYLDIYLTDAPTNLAAKSSSLLTKTSSSDLLLERWFFSVSPNVEKKSKEDLILVGMLKAAITTIRSIYSATLIFPTHQLFKDLESFSNTDTSQPALSKTIKFRLFNDEETFKYLKFAPGSAQNFGVSSSQASVIVKIGHFLFDPMQILKDLMLQSGLSMPPKIPKISQPLSPPQSPKTSQPLRQPQSPRISQPLSPNSPQSVPKSIFQNNSTSTSFSPSSSPDVAQTRLEKEKQDSKLKGKALLKAKGKLGPKTEEPNLPRIVFENAIITKKNAVKVEKDEIEECFEKADKEFEKGIIIDNFGNQIRKWNGLYNAHFFETINNASKILSKSVMEVPVLSQNTDNLMSISKDISLTKQKIDKMYFR